MPDEMLSHVMVAILKATGLPASKLGDICVGMFITDRLNGSGGADKSSGFVSRYKF